MAFSPTALIMLFSTQLMDELVSTTHTFSSKSLPETKALITAINSLLDLTIFWNSSTIKSLVSPDNLRMLLSRCAYSLYMSFFCNFSFSFSSSIFSKKPSSLPIKLQSIISFLSRLICSSSEA